MDAREPLGLLGLGRDIGGLGAEELLVGRRKGTDVGHVAEGSEHAITARECTT